ncbi:hypothetical protein [Lysobacter enzymogenes]|uniref:hypothetical protein n=1 Tax=Lysobacter enzymogenes TaxID=69 RepID=UPI0008976A45|nr:hypothetical protein [Lysobacter enzymogenes]SDW95085.1 hypothetical protein SAMN05421681_103314 [Lysobacter enzymogenes]
MSLPESCFASTAAHARDITLPDGSVHTMHFKELPAIEFRLWRHREQSEDEQTRFDALPMLLVAGICNPDGSPALPLKMAKRLKGEPMNALLVALLEVNGVTAGAQAEQGND